MSTQTKWVIRICALLCLVGLICWSRYDFGEIHRNIDAREWLIPRLIQLGLILFSGLLVLIFWVIFEVFWKFGAEIKELREELRDLRADILGHGIQVTLRNIDD